MPSLTQLKYLVSVDKNRHFGKAAQECHVSQPSLSIQIQKMEEELDLIFFDRSKKPILPTEMGKILIKQAKVVLAEHRRLEELAQQKQGGLQGDFHLGVIPTLSPYLLPLFVESFSHRYPEVNLIIGEYKTEEIIEHLDNDSLDAGLLVTPLHEAKIIERALFFEPFVIFTSLNHPLGGKSYVSEADLTQDEIWLLDEGHCLRNQVLNVCGLHHKRSPLKNVQFDSGNLETLKSLIRKGKGYTLLPQLAIEDLSSSEKKSMIKQFKTPVPTREVSLVHSRSFLKEPIIEALEQEILNQIPSELSSLKKKDLSIVEID